LNAPLSSVPWLQPGARVGGRGPSRGNGFPAGLGGTGYQPVPLGNLPNRMGSAPEHPERLLIFQRHPRSVRQVAGRHRLVACATRDESRRAQLALQHRNEDLLPAFLLSRDGLRGVEPLFQTKPRGRFLNAQHAPAIGEFQQEQFNAAFHKRSVGLAANFHQRGNKNARARILPIKPLGNTFHAMSAVEVIEEIKKLPVDEQTKVKEFVNGSPAPSAAKPKREVDEEFKKAADHVFTKNAELFRKLAQ
jgi:hypothetical protein